MTHPRRHRAWLHHAFLTVAGGGALLVVACGKESSGPPPATSGTVVIQLDHEVGGQPLNLGAFAYTNTAGNTFAVDRLRYYVSDIVLHRSDGSTHATDGITLCEFADDATHEITIHDVPSGSYDSVTLTFGLDDAHNVTDGLPSTPANEAMRWPDALGGGYHYMFLEGRFRDTTGVDEPFVVETGRVVAGGTSTSHFFDVTLPGSTISVETGTVTLLADMDLDRWFADPVYDFNAHATDMAGDLAAQGILRQNGPSVFVSPAPDEVDVQVFGFPPMIVPADNPTTRQGIFLGRLLYYDPILSADSTLACAGCHRPERSFSDDTRFSDGVDGIFGERNAPSLVNPGWRRELFWDGRAATLEQQALGPVENPIEMNLPWPEAVRRVQRSTRYPSLFLRAFGSSTITSDRVVKAIAQFERSMVSKNAKYDRVYAGLDEFTAAELRGLDIFSRETGDCFHCHGQSLLFTDNLFHNIGVDPVIVDRGLGGQTGLETDMGKFKTPSLRNVERTAPYIHDGRFNTLEEVVQHYNSGGFRTPTVDPLIRVGVGLGLTPQQVDDLVAFLKTLTDDSYATNPDYQNPYR